MGLYAGLKGKGWEIAGLLAVCTALALPTAAQEEECARRSSGTFEARFIDQPPSDFTEPQTRFHPFGEVILPSDGCPSQVGESTTMQLRGVVLHLSEWIGRQRRGTWPFVGEVAYRPGEDRLGGAAGADSVDDGMAGQGRLSTFVIDDYTERDREASAQGESFDQDTNTAILGFDYRVGSSLFLGGTLNIVDGETELDDNVAVIEMDALIWGLHGAKYWGNSLFLEGLVSYSEPDIDIERFDGTFDYTAATDARQWSGDISLGYAYSLNRWRITPIARAFHLRGYVDGYSETATSGAIVIGPGGAVPATENVDRQYLDSTTVDLSIQTDYVMLMEWGVLIPSLKLAYMREFADANKVSGSVSSLGHSAAIAGRPDDPDENTFTATAGASAQFRHGYSAFLVYERLFGHDFLDQDSVVVGFRYEFPQGALASPPPMTPGPR